MNRVITLSLIFTLFSLALISCGSNQADMQSSHNDINPLPACPDTPNCMRTATLMESDSTAVMRALLKVLNEEAETVESNEDSLSIDAVYRIPVFGWRDDVTIQLKDETANKTILFIRSASREGYSDLGVNNRRVKRILKKTRSELRP